MTTIHYVASGVIATAGSAAVAASNVWQLTAFLALGASIGVLWSCLSKEAKEDGRMTKARILAGIVGGVCIPRLIEFIIPWKIIQLAEADPLIVIAIGFLFAVAGFYLMHSALRRVEKRQNAIGGMLANTVERKIRSVTGDSRDPSDNENSDSTNGAASGSSGASPADRG